MKAQRGRKTIKDGKLFTFKFDPRVARYLPAEAKHSNKSMTAIIEETLLFRKQLKAWPPKIAA